MTARQGNIVHNWLTWVAGIGATLCTAMMISVSGAFIDMRDQSIKMEGVPDDIKAIKAEIGVITSLTANHSWRIEAIEKNPRR